MRPVLPTFDYGTCQAFGECVAACPTACLDLWNDRPSLLVPGHCISCGICQWICPTQAVHLAPDDDLKLGQPTTTEPHNRQN